MPDQPHNQEPQAREEAAVIREMICHENDLINHRITWLTTVQGFLFGALAFAWDKKDAAPVIYLLAILGTSISLSAFTTLHVAIKAVDRLIEWWDGRYPNYSGPDIIGWRKVPGSRSSFLFMRPWRFIPFAFCVTWALEAIRITRLVERR